MFYDKLFSSLDFTLPRASTGQQGFLKEAMICAFIVYILVLSLYWYILR